MATEGKTIDALSQFELSPMLGIVGKAVSFSQSNAFMLVALLLSAGLMLGSARRGALIPGRFQALGESAYEFIAGMVRDQVGDEGKKYFPFVFSVFMFVLFGNLLGMLPYAFTFTSHIAVTLALAVVVFLTVTVIAIARHGMHFFSYFFPEGAPVWLAPIIIPVEVISYFSRVVSLSVRLFANMLAGHITVKVFAGLVVALGALGIGGWIGAILPLAMTVAITALEVLVAFLQAYVFTVLTCMYLNDAIHPGH